MDVYDRIQAQDMMKNAVIIAAFVYHAANRDALLPRKTLPRPQPPQTGGRRRRPSRKELQSSIMDSMCARSSDG